MKKNKPGEIMFPLIDIFNDPHISIAKEKEPEIDYDTISRQAAIALIENESRKL